LLDGQVVAWRVRSGDGANGQIGDGKIYQRSVPRAVAGGLSFKAVSAGQAHSCGETTINQAFCWGFNGWGGLGDGTTTSRLKPVAVHGGHSFDRLSAGSVFTCAKTPSSVAYCWGYNIAGPLGDGTTTNRLEPVAVHGPCEVTPCTPNAVDAVGRVRSHAGCWPRS
jgi:alpha-tubulin suppressor-like RCC1 family protein